MQGLNSLSIINPYWQPLRDARKGLDHCQVELPTSTTHSNHIQIRTLTAGRRSGPGRRIRGGEGGGELPSYPNIVPITDSQDQRLYWTYRDAWVEAGADGSFAGALMIRNHHPATS